MGLTACGSSNGSEETIDSNDGGITFNITNVGDCEYLYHDGGYMAHKGDCNNPKHKGEEDDEWD